MAGKEPTKTVHPINKLLGARIAELRQKFGLSQEELAEMSGTSQPYIVKIERGSVNISTKMIGNIADAFGVEPSLLFDYRHDLPGDALKTKLDKLIERATPEQLKNIVRIAEIIVF